MTHWRTPIKFTRRRLPPSEAGNSSDFHQMLFIQEFGRTPFAQACVDVLALIFGIIFACIFTLALAAGIYSILVWFLD